MKYKEIIGGTKEEAEIKFPWLKEAVFEDAVIDIRGSGVDFIDSFCEGGLWQYAILRNGLWEDPFIDVIEIKDSIVNFDEPIFDSKSLVDDILFKSQYKRRI